MEDEKTEMTFDLVKQFIESNKDSVEVKELTAGFINYDVVDNYLNGDEGKKVLQPRLDRHFTKSLDSWKDNNLQTIIDQKINESHPAETEADKKLRQMQDRLNLMENEKNRSSIKATAMMELNEKGLPSSVADFMVADSLESTRDRINMFETEFKMAVKAEVETRLKTSGGTPKHSDSQEGTDGLTKASLLKMDYNQRLDFYQKNPQLFNQIMKG